MIEKNKKYTGEEIKKLFKEAVGKTIEKLSKKLEEAREEKGDRDPMAEMMFTMQNLLVTSKLEEELFKEDK